jgi:pimeloyl-ACP methyl ester carboxylesterase
MDTLNMRTGGEGEPAILFLHGLGATGAVWAHLTELVPRRVLVPDLPGHGPSAPLPHYSFDTLAAAVARALPGTGPLVVAGHSLGGVLALELASGRYDVEVAGVLALGVKVEWSQDDLGRVATLAARPPRVFETQADADQAYLKVSGLLGIAPADPAGLRRTGHAGAARRGAVPGRAGGGRERPDEPSRPATRAGPGRGHPHRPRAQRPCRGPSRRTRPVGALRRLKARGQPSYPTRRLLRTPRHHRTRKA